MNISLSSCIFNVSGIIGAIAANDGYIKGTLSDTSMESEYLGIRFDVPEGYIMSTPEEIDSYIDFGGELVFKDESKQILDYAKANTVYEMMAHAPSGNPNVLLCCERVPDNMTVENYIEAVSSQLISIAELSYYMDGELYTTIIGGQEYTVLPMTCQNEGVELYQEYMVRRHEKRMVSIIISYDGYTFDEAQELIDAFSVIK